MTLKMAPGTRSREVREGVSMCRRLVPVRLEHDCDSAFNQLFFFFFAFFASSREYLPGPR
jgi:hypothetical protein